MARALALLSTPSSSGLFADIATLGLVAAGFAAFAFGLHALGRRLDGYQRLALGPVLAAAYGCLGLLGLAVLCSRLGMRGIRVSQAIFLGVALYGVVRALGCLPAAWRAGRRLSRPELVKPAVLLLAFTWTVIFWVRVFRSHVALPSYHDGISHTAFYLRILEAGVPTLERVPIGFASVFGEQFFYFYPTGTHALLAIGAGFWGQIGVASQAGVLKAGFTLTVIGLAWSLYWALRRLVPSMPWWVCLATLLVASCTSRFPLEAAHEGGMTRMLGHLLFVPIYAHVLLGHLDALRLRVPAGLVLGLALLVHPSVCFTLGALLCYSALWQAWRERSPRELLRGFGGLALALVIGAGLAASFVAANLNMAAASSFARTVSTQTALERLAEGWHTFFATEYRTAPYHPYLMALGLVLLVGWRRQLGLAGRVVVFPFFMIALTLTVLAAPLLPSALLQLLGAAFYNLVPRIIELLFEAFGLCLAAALWALALLAQHLAARYPLAQRGRRFGASAERAERVPGAWFPSAAACVAVVVVAGAALLQLGLWSWTRDHIAYWDNEFQTPRVEKLRPLGRWIERHTKPNALLMHAPFDSEIWEAWTGRRGIFMYGECPIYAKGAACGRRKAFVAEHLARLSDRLLRPTPTEPCLADVRAFRRPVYFLVPWELRSTLGSKAALCLDAKFVAHPGGTLAIVQYRPDS